MCEPITLAAIAGGLTAGATGTAAGAAALGMTAALTPLQAIMMGATVGSSVLSAGSAYEQGQVAKATAQSNAQMADYAAQDALHRGEEDAQTLQRRGSALKSAQRAGMAAKGLDISYGMAADLQDQTEFFTQVDVATARRNAQREAWQQRTRGQNMLAQGEADARNGLFRATGSLLTGAGQVADRWYPRDPTHLKTR